MAKRKEIDIAYKTWLVEECLAGRMRGREAARRAGVGATTMQNWISRYKAEGISAFEPIKGSRVYREEVKTAAAEDYLAGRGSLRTISERYKIRSPQLVMDWVKVYNRHNENNTETGGIVMADRRNYTMEERVQIVKEHIDAGKSISALAAEHGLSYNLVKSWIQKYKAMGIAGLEDRRGHRTAAQTPRTPEEELRIRNAQLEREIYLLKMENDLLKKVKELERGVG